MSFQVSTMLLSWSDDRGSISLAWNALNFSGNNICKTIRWMKEGCLLPKENTLLARKKDLLWPRYEAPKRLTPFPGTSSRKSAFSKSMIMTLIFLSGLYSS